MTDGKEATPWWHQKVKDTIRANKVSCKAWLNNKVETALHQL